MKECANILQNCSSAAMDSATKSLFYLCAFLFSVNEYLTQSKQSRAVVAGGEVRQLTHYYPYGLPWAETLVPTHSLRKYSGKELYTHSGYDTYNFEARQYHPAVPRFTSPDPLAESNSGLSPYTYCSANPINRIDPTGLSDYICEANNSHRYVDDGNNQVIELTAESWTKMVEIDFNSGHETYQEIQSEGKVREDLFPTIEPVIPPEQCSVWKNGANCFDLACKTNNAVVSGPSQRIDTYNEQEGIYDSEVGIKYAITQLSKGLGVVAGVNYNNDSPKDYNVNKNTRHFITLVGSGIEVTTSGFKNYLMYYDNGSSNRIRNTNVINNRILPSFLKNSNIKIWTDENTNFEKISYTITEIRTNGKKK